METRRHSLFTAPALAASLLAASCGGSGDSGTVPGPTGPTSSLSTIDTTVNREGIVPLPVTVDPRIRSIFSTYAELTAPNGRRIHFLSQAGVPDAILFRVRGVFRQHLKSAPGSTLGSDKSAIFNRIASKETTVAVYENSATFDPMDADVAVFMELFDGIVASVDASGVVQEGSTSYLLPDPAIDDTLNATVQVALRFGISEGSPQFQSDLTTAALNALTNDLYRPDPGLSQGEIDDAYLGLALSVYYGVWGHDPNGDGTAGANREYDFADRAAMQAGDPAMVLVIESFFSPSQSFPAYLDETFTGTFEMQFDPLLPYSHRSRYLERAGMRGTGVARINGNELDNTFLGGKSADGFEGRGGNDILEGDAGADIAYFSGNRADYTIAPVDMTVTRVTDMIPGRDGVDELRGIRQIHFADIVVDL